MQFSIMNKYLLVKRVVVEAKTESGLFLTTSAAPISDEATVIQSSIPTIIPGDKVLINRRGYPAIRFGTEDCLVITDEDIIGTWKGEECKL